MYRSLWPALFSLFFSACTGVPLTNPGPDLDGTKWAYESHGKDQAIHEAHPGVQTTIEFDADRLSGNAGCNSYFGQFEISDSDIKIGETGSTRMLCERHTMDQEDQFLASLAKASSFSIEDQTLRLTLTDGGTLVFRRLDQSGPIIDHGGLHTFKTCVEAGGMAYGPQLDAQCVIDKTVYFETGAPQISLSRCTSYFDGCNSCMVTDGIMSACTLAACPEAYDVPACYIGELRVTDAVGRVIEIRDTEIHVAFDDIIERFAIGSDISVEGIEIGDQVELSVGYGDDGSLPKVLNLAAL